MNKEPLKAAVVGMGKMGLLHASILNVIPDVQLVAVCETNAFTGRLLRKVLGNVRLVTDVEDLLGLDLDAVFITTPPQSHFGLAKKIREANIARNLFVEKPLCSNYYESKQLSDLMHIHGGIGMVGYLRRFMVTFSKAKTLLEEGAIGEPVSFSVEAFSSDFCGLSENPKASIARGGVLRDLGSHAIDLMLWLFDSVEVNSAKIESLTGTGSEDAVYFTVKGVTNPLQGEVYVSWCKEGYRMPEVVFSIKGTKGTIEVNDDKINLGLEGSKDSTWYRHNLDDNVSFWLGGPEYYREDAYFVQSAIANLPTEPNFDTASKVDLFIDTIKQRAGTNGQHE